MIRFGCSWRNRPFADDLQSMPAPTRGSERAYRFVKNAECVAGVDALELSKDVLFVQARASGRHAVIKPALA